MLSAPANLQPLQHTHPAPVATSMEAAAESTAATEYLHWIVSITVTTTVTVAVTVAVTVGT